MLCNLPLAIFFLNAVDSSFLARDSWYKRCATKHSALTGHSQKLARGNCESWMSTHRLDEITYFHRELMAENLAKVVLLERTLKFRACGLKSTRTEILHTWVVFECRQLTPLQEKETLWLWRNHYSRYLKWVFLNFFCGTRSKWHSKNPLENFPGQSRSLKCRGNNLWSLLCSSSLGKSHTSPTGL